MKKKPSLAKTKKPGKRNQFLKIEEEELMSESGFYKDYTNRTIEQEDVMKPESSILGYRRH